MQKFEPDQLVLVHFFNGGLWRLRRYSIYIDGYGHETQDGNVWAHECIIPYAGHDHLLGKTDFPLPEPEPAPETEEKPATVTPWEPKKGELVAVARLRSGPWRARVFLYKEKGFFICKNENLPKEVDDFTFCEPLRKHFTIPEE